MANRRRWSEQERREILEAQSLSGLSVAAFARVTGLAYTTLAGWRRSARERRSGTVHLVPVEVEEAEETTGVLEVAGGEGVELLVGDVVVRVGVGFCDTTLVRVLRALHSC